MRDLALTFTKGAPVNALKERMVLEVIQPILPKPVLSFTTKSAAKKKKIQTFQLLQYTDSVAKQSEVVDLNNCSLSSGVANSKIQDSPRH